MAANKPIHNHIFYDNVSTTDETETCIMPVVADESTINLEFITTGTFTAKIYGSIFDADADSFKPYPAFKMPTFDLISDTITDGNYFYQVDITAIDYLKVVFTAVDSPITVRGKVVG